MRSPLQLTRGERRCCNLIFDYLLFLFHRHSSPIRPLPPPPAAPLCPAVPTLLSLPAGSAGRPWLPGWEGPPAAPVRDRVAPGGGVRTVGRVFRHCSLLWRGETLAVRGTPALRGLELSAGLNELLGREPSVKRQFLRQDVPHGRHDGLRFHGPPAPGPPAGHRLLAAGHGPGGLAPGKGVLRSWAWRRAPHPEVAFWKHLSCLGQGLEASPPTGVSWCPELRGVAHPSGW